jgi:diaminopropionate ammonia-lyase
VSTNPLFVTNPQHIHGPPVSAGSANDEIRAFHRTLPDYAVTPLVPLPTIATELALGSVLVKDESRRLGLPAFKMLGASWAVHRALARRDPGASTPRLVTATDGNHGRAVARMARLLDLPARVVVPAGVSPRAIALIREEGAVVEELPASYDDAVRRAAQLADADDASVLVQDTSWPGYEDVPSWIVDGYATLFAEAAEQSAELELDIGLLVVPAGVGSLAHAAVRFGASLPDCRVVVVESDVAACIGASLAAGELTSVETGETSMAGLNCGTPSYLAWPHLHAGLAGAVTVDDEQARSAMADLGAAGVDSGPCGAAGLAGLRHLAVAPAREVLRLDDTSTVLLLNTEGVASSH